MIKEIEERAAKAYGVYAAAPRLNIVRKDVPRLCSEIRRLRAELDALKAGKEKQNV